MNYKDDCYGGHLRYQNVAIFAIIYVHRSAVAEW